MKWLAAGLTLVNVATVSGLIFGILSRGLTTVNASGALALGVFAAILAYFRVSDFEIHPGVGDSSDEEKTRRVAEFRSTPLSTNKRYDLLKWIVVSCFTLFAIRSFCCLLYIDGNQLKIQSPNNLGDLALHVTYIKNFANGVALWPDNPIYVDSNLRYPAGVDLFNALLYLFHVDLIQGLVWVGLLGSLATFYAFYRWGGAFAVASFLFNGGIVGFQFFRTLQFRDYQGVSAVAWKSIPLSMLVTQRGLLYAIPAGLLLLWHWRERFFRDDFVAPGVPTVSPGGSRGGYVPLPFWLELALYASMPLFHVHTFLALSGILAFLFLCGNARMRWHVALLIGSALLPATFFVFLVSDNLRARSMIQWHPGWVQDDGDFKAPFFQFWFYNFGIWMPFVIVLLAVCGWHAYRSGTKPKFELFAAIALATVALCVWRIWESGFHWSFAVFLVFGFALLGWCVWRVGKTGFTWNEKFPEEIAFLLVAVVIFIAGLLFKFAAWGWDNLKLMIWSYFLVLPFLRTQLIAKWSAPVRVGVCVALFGSGFISLLGGLAAGRTGYGFADRAELDGVGHAIRKLSVEARFAAYPTYNHPLLLQGRKVVLGYPGHLWTQGFENYRELEIRLSQLMNGAENWREIARRLQVRYIFWGREETANYAESKRPWEKTAPLIASGNWGAIYDVEQTRQAR
jgi:hypothetical protein